MSSTGTSTAPDLILLISADSQDAARLRDVFTQHGYQVAIAKDLRSARSTIQSRVPVALLLVGYRWQEPEIRELSLLRLKLWRGSIVVLGEQSEETRAAMLDQGADDCIGMDCSGRELVARVKALQRFAMRLTEMTIIPGALVLDTQDRRLRRIDGPRKSWELVGEEFRLCKALSVRPGATVPHGNLKEFIWEGPASDSSLRRLVCRANRRTEGVRILRVGSDHGVGYRFEFLAESE